MVQMSLLIQSYLLQMYKLNPIVRNKNISYRSAITIEPLIFQT
jgi:hypothetical protein